MKGIVRWFSPLKGYGFIYSREAGRDFFVHVSAIPKKADGERVIYKDDQVEFETEEAVKGLKAVNVKIILKGENHGSTNN